ncbi:MAG: TPM domain-containing protein [Eubacteriales bacterium]|nr:TPM domain-containing protein [Eubacteriales bacterium]
MKKGIAIALTLVLCLSLGAALAAEERVFDQAGLFTSSEESQLNQLIAQFQQDTGMDFVILTTDVSQSDSSHNDDSDDFYDQGGFGLGDEKSGILYYLNMTDRYHYLSTCGAMIDYMTDERIDSAIEEIGSYLKSGRCADAAAAMIAKVEQYVRQGIPEGQYRYDVITGEILTARHKALTSNEILISAVLGLILCVATVMIVKSRYQLKGSTYDYDYEDNSSLTMTDSEDTYLRTTTTQTRKPDPPTNNGGGGFGGGGSGVHTSSGGSSHGGGGGHF